MLEMVTRAHMGSQGRIRESIGTNTQLKKRIVLVTYKNEWKRPSYKNNARGTKLEDGKVVGGAGRLTDAVVDRIQTYYGYAIRNNKGNMEKIVNAIWAIFFHIIGGPSSESLATQHKYCQKTDDTWCKYEQDAQNNTNFYDESKCLPYIFREQLKKIFLRLASHNLLRGCQQGLTPNQNESLKSVAWSRCPKQLFCGVHRLTISVCDVISQFNNGAKGRSRLFKSLSMDVGDISLKGLKREQAIRLREAASKVTLKYKIRRQMLRSIRKNPKKDKSYITGAFTNKSVPEIDFTNEPGSSEPVLKKKKKI